MAFFSTIIPTFNRAHLLGAAIESALTQTFDDQQIIVVDDGSTDQTTRLVEQFWPRVELVSLSNQGPGGARNRGLAVARGEYVAFLDSDDLWFNWTLQTYREVIEARKYPAILTGRPFIFTDEQALQTLRPRTPGPTTTLAFPDYFASSDEWRWFGVSSFVIRTEALRAVGGFDEDVRVAEDADLLMRLGDVPNFVQITSPTTFAYRSHEASLRSNRDAALRGAWNLIDRERQGKYPGGAVRASARREILTRQLRPFALELLATPQRAQAWTIFRAMLPWQFGRWRYLAGFLWRAMRTRGRQA